MWISIMFIDKVFMTEKIYWQILILILGLILALLEIVLALGIFFLLGVGQIGYRELPPG
jgi:hypothetical protein